METTKLSSKGQVIIPKTFRVAHHWNPGLELIATAMGDGILLQPKTSFAQTSLDDVVNSLKYSGKPKSQEDIDNALKQAAKNAWHAGN